MPSRSRLPTPGNAPSTAANAAIRAKSIAGSAASISDADAPTGAGTSAIRRSRYHWKDDLQRNPLVLPEVLRRTRTPHCSKLPAGAGGRSDAALHQRRDEQV